MTLHERKYTARGYWPRSDARSTNNYQDRLDVAYNVWSNDDPSNIPAAERLNLLFIHGSQCCKEIWNYHIQTAYAKWGPVLDKVISVDLVTHGDSALLNRDKLGYIALWEDEARDVGIIIRDVMERGDFEGPLISVGHSKGATISMLISCFEPALLDGVVLVDPIWGGSDPSKALMANVFIVELGMRVDTEFPDWAAYKKYMDTRFAKNFDPRVRDPFTSGLAVVNNDGVSVSMKASREDQVAAYLSGNVIVNAIREIWPFMKKQALIIQGDQQKQDMGRGNQVLDEVLPNSRLVEIPGGGHNIPFEKPDECIAVWEPFIEEQFQRAKTAPRRWSRGLNQKQLRQFQIDGVAATLAERRLAIKEHRQTKL